MVLDQPDRRAGAASYPELLEDSADVNLRGARRDVQVRADLGAVRRAAPSAASLTAFRRRFGKATSTCSPCDGSSSTKTPR
jgi:hypothetical protein